MMRLTIAPEPSFFDEKVRKPGKRALAARSEGGKELPPLCRAGDNANAFKGGFRLWAGAARRTTGRKRA